MVYRGCVVKVESEFAVVLTSTMEYLKVVKKDGLQEGKEIIFLHDDIYKKNKASIRTVALAAAMFLVMIVSMTWLNPWSATRVLANTVAIVSIDINPSVELEINQEQEVLKVIPINEDGKKVVSEDLVGMVIDEAVLAIVGRAGELNYLTEKRNTVLISTTMTSEKVSLDGKEIVEKIEQKLEEKADIKEIHIAYLEGKKEDIEKARAQHVSTGKYGVFKRAENGGEKLTIEEIKELKVQQILDKGVGKLKVKELKKKISLDKAGNDKEMEPEDRTSGEKENQPPGQEISPGLQKAPGLEKAPGQIKKAVLDKSQNNKDENQEDKDKEEKEQTIEEKNKEEEQGKSKDRKERAKEEELKKWKIWLEKQKQGR